MCCKKSYISKRTYHLAQIWGLIRLYKQILLYKTYLPPNSYLPVGTFRNKLFYATGPRPDLLSWCNCNLTYLAPILSRAPNMRRARRNRYSYKGPESQGAPDNFLLDGIRQTVCHDLMPSSGKKNKRAIVLQLMSAYVNLWISCTTTKKWPNLSLFHCLFNAATRINKA